MPVPATFEDCAPSIKMAVFAKLSLRRARSLNEPPSSREDPRRTGFSAHGARPGGPGSYTQKRVLRRVEPVYILDRRSNLYRSMGPFELAREPESCRVTVSDQFAWRTVNDQICGFRRTRTVVFGTRMR